MTTALAIRLREFNQRKCPPLAPRRYLSARDVSPCRPIRRSERVPQDEAAAAGPTRSTGSGIAEKQGARPCGWFRFDVGRALPSHGREMQFRPSCSEAQKPIHGISPLRPTCGEAFASAFPPDFRRLCSNSSLICRTKSMSFSWSYSFEARSQSSLNRGASSISTIITSLSKLNRRAIRIGFAAGDYLLLSTLRNVHSFAPANFSKKCLRLTSERS